MFTGLSERQFAKFVGIVAGRGGQQTGAGRRWGAAAGRPGAVGGRRHYRTNLALRQIAPLFGVSKSAAGRIVDHLAPHLVLESQTRRHRPAAVLIVDGTLLPTHNRSMSARSKN
ncbi:hypothetical protein Athai_14210 [Actinocatenispora thailandica]|uniref:Transposase Helix-turn-helix domain-containing protein n=1 Tax=Actinocatenispora thailandica TaxID=227318 RepID=A0A7R7HVL6_9ACTN|nr:transposase family protein [Actinocatenispora thailandica]BCJ33918.1 hypothetical protein Athai_14210 [Actinocatenispora thailandica]